MIGALIASIVVATNSVTFSAKATGVALGSPLEFAFVDGASDRDYESMFVTDDSLAAIAAAFRKAGLRGGIACDAVKCDFWPTGEVLSMSPKFEDFIANADAAPLPKFVFTGGNGDVTNSPTPVFCTYNLGNALISFDGALPQGEVYGKYQPKVALEKGKSFEFTFAWDGKSAIRSTTPDFPADKTVAEAKKVAEALEKLDSLDFRINGAKPGQLYYRAFLPLEKWRDRRERLVQPLEIRLSGTNVTYTVVEEDWSVDGDDPKLTPRQIPFAEALKVKTSACLIYAPAATKLAAIYDLKRRLPATLVNWYVYVD